MQDIARRDVLRGALLGPLVWSVGEIGTGVPELKDLEGRKIEKIADVENMSAIEKEHFIKIELPDNIRAGEPFEARFSMPDHPNGKVHHITWLRVFLDDDLVTFVTFAAVWQKPEATFTFVFAKGGRIDAVAECTMDGLWGMSAPIVITGSIEPPEAPADASIGST